MISTEQTEICNENIMENYLQKFANSMNAWYSENWNPISKFRSMLIDENQVKNISNFVTHSRYDEIKTQYHLINSKNISKKSPTQSRTELSHSFMSS